MHVYPDIVIVNEHDEVIGSMPLLEAKASGQICRSCRVIMFNESGKLLLQRRGPTVFKPCLYDHSAAGHVDVGETYEVAARRELKEELGVSDVQLFTVAISVRSNDFFSGIFTTVIPDETILTINPEEVAEIKWFSIDELEQALTETPHLFTPEFIQTWTSFRDKMTTS